VKVLTTPHDLALCFREVIEKAAEGLGLTVRELLRETGTVRYATTVGTNAIIQRTGPRLGLIAGEGAGERLYARDGEADAVFALFLSPDMVAGIASLDDPEAVGAAMRELLDGSARGLVCALPAAAGEHRVRERFEEQYPRHCLDAVPLLLSGEIARDDDDFRRTATALFNAYVHPDVAGYLYRAEDYLRDHGSRRPLLVVHNDGGCARVAKTVAARTYNSGPAAGLLGAREVAALYGLDDLVTFDMGGTSLDVAILAGGAVPLREHGMVEGVDPVAAAAEALRVMEDDMGERIADELQRRGVDPAGATMLAYGGAGPMHAAGIAEQAGIRRIVTVPFAAVFSAFGASSADVLHAYHGDDREALRRRALRDMRGEGFGPDEIELAESGTDGAASVTATAALEHFRFPSQAADVTTPSQRTSREVHWPRGPTHDTAIFDAGQLQPGAATTGPAIVEALDTTIVVPPGWGFRVDEHGNGRLEASE